MTEEEDSAGGQLLGLLGGFMVTQAISVVASAGIADLVDREPVPVAELAAQVEVDPDALRRFLRFLAGSGVFTEVVSGSFAHTPLSRCLRADAPGSLRPIAICFGQEHYRAWAEAAYSLRTGLPGFDRAYGAPYFDFLGTHPEVAANFNRAMAGTAFARGDRLLDYEWDAVSGTVVDVGGGNGSLLLRVLAAHPHLRGVVLDLPVAAAQARDAVAAAGLGDRCTTVEGSFFDEVPPGDIQVLSQILHDWDDEGCLSILRSCRRAIGEAGRLLILDYIVPEGNEPSRSKLIDLHMLVLLGGRERTEREWLGLLEKGGFRLNRTYHGTRIDLLEALPE